MQQTTRMKKRARERKRREKIRVWRRRKTEWKQLRREGRMDVRRRLGKNTGSGGSGFMPRIDNLDVKSYIRWMCLSVTYWWPLKRVKLIVCREQSLNPLHLPPLSDSFSLLYVCVSMHRQLCVGWLNAVFKQAKWVNILSNIYKYIQTNQSPCWVMCVRLIFETRHTKPSLKNL